MGGYPSLKVQQMAVNQEGKQHCRNWVRQRGARWFVQAYTPRQAITPATIVARGSPCEFDLPPASSFFCLC